ncbi:MAG: oxygen-independent coproporphyrinogen III oxidase [Idiomarina sp.]|nr:oxygen-independent coproporphyrinogen III oxidase [Idiomarina sp.]
MTSFNWNSALVKKYNINGPRYTSYPTALALEDTFDTARVKTALMGSNEALSLYIHLPFCHQLCYYCGCNKVITRHQHKADRYLDALELEMRSYAPLTAHRNIANLHLGGGTPTFLTEAQLTRLIAMLKVELNFEPASADEVSIEIDPRSCSLEKLAHLRKLGFNRVSYGVQDFNEHVQIAINRVQSEMLVRDLVNESKALGFTSINLDLVYGLPHQNSENFALSLNKVIELDPDRISLFSYAHLPQRFAAQRKIPDHTLPQGEEKQALLLQGIEALTAAGYQFIGMDHFAKADDELAKAQREGRMQRNFQGYTTHGSDSLLGLGVSSISQVNGVIWQHAKDLPEYYHFIEQAELPVIKGVSLCRDDQLRAALIAQTICHFEVNFADFAQIWGIDFHQYFADSIPLLESYQADGLIVMNSDSLQVTDEGRLWVRVICSAFDAYLNPDQQQYSKVI